MDPRRIIGSGITASAIVHLSFLVLVIFFTEVRPFSSVTAEPISVDIVAPSEVKSDPPPASKSEDSNSFDAPAKPADSSPAAAQPPPQQAQADPPPAADAEQQVAAPTPQPQPEPQQPLPSTSQQAYVPAQPDLSVKYHVMLGLPQANPGDGFDAVAIQKADGQKCERCWNYSVRVGEFERYPTVCERCAEALGEIEKAAAA